MSRNDESSGAGKDVLLMRTWNDTEAEMVRQLLRGYGIPCQVVSDVPHTVFPINVDGLGEIRILVTREHYQAAQSRLAEHRRQGFELVANEVAEEEEQNGEDREPEDEIERGQGKEETGPGERR